MARVLIVGGGCRGRALASALDAGGHAVRVSTRSEQGRAAIEQAGAECWIGDPDVIGSLRYALDRVAILVWALASASGDPAATAALHADRLDMLLSNVLDSTVRGIVYEAEGSLAAEVLSAGAGRVAEAAAKSRIPLEILRHDPADAAGWAAGARAAVDRLLTSG